MIYLAVKQKLLHLDNAQFMGIKVLLSIILSLLVASILWLLLSGIIVLGMNKMVYILFWIALFLVFLLNVWIISRVDSKPIITVLVICLIIGMVAPYFMATNSIHLKI